MPETRTIKVYTFDELSDESTSGFIGSMSPKQRATEKISEWLQEGRNDDLLECVFSPVLEDYGFPTDKVEWSLGCSQGDGMAFYGSVDVETFLRKVKKLRHFYNLGPANPSIVIRKNDWGNHYSHWNTMTVEGEIYDAVTERRAELLGELESLVQETVKDVSRQLERAGYDWLEVSEEEIRELCDANDHRFNADGTLA